MARWDTRREREGRTARCALIICLLTTFVLFLRVLPTTMMVLRMTGATVLSKIRRGIISALVVAASTVAEQRFGFHRHWRLNYDKHLNSVKVPQSPSKSLDEGQNDQSRHQDQLGKNFKKNRCGVIATPGYMFTTMPKTMEKTTKPLEPLMKPEKTMEMKPRATQFSMESFVTSIYQLCVMYLDALESFKFPSILNFYQIIQSSIAYVFNILLFWIAQGDNFIAEMCPIGDAAIETGKLVLSSYLKVILAAGYHLDLFFIASCQPIINLMKQMPYLGLVVEYFDAVFKCVLSFFFVPEDDLAKANVISEEEEIVKESNGSPRRKRDSSAQHSVPIRKNKSVEETTPVSST